jgi:hypothetical protein
MSERFLRWLDESIVGIASEISGEFDSRRDRAIRIGDEIRAEATRQGFSWEEIDEDSDTIAKRAYAISRSRRWDFLRDLLPFV